MDGRILSMSDWLHYHCQMEHILLSLSVASKAEAILRGRASYALTINLRFSQMHITIPPTMHLRHKATEPVLVWVISSGQSGLTSMPICRP